MHKGLYHDESRKEEYRQYASKNNSSIESREILDESQIGDDVSLEDLEKSFQQGMEMAIRIIKMNRNELP